MQENLTKNIEFWGFFRAEGARKKSCFSVRPCHPSMLLLLNFSYVVRLRMLGMWCWYRPIVEEMRLHDYSMIVTLWSYRVPCFPVQCHDCESTLNTMLSFLRSWSIARQPIMKEFLREEYQIENRVLKSMPPACTERTRSGRWMWSSGFKRYRATTWQHIRSLEEKTKKFQKAKDATLTSTQFSLPQLLLSIELAEHRCRIS